MDAPQGMSPEEMRMVKAGAAMRYAELGIRPETADYVFERFTAKQARLAGIEPQLDPKIAKLITGLRTVVRPAKVAEKSTV